MTGLRLLADDLTGALDTAAELVGLAGAVQAFWHGAIPAELPANAALDSGTRELDVAAAVATVAGLAWTLRGAEIAYKKVDSLLRGPTLAEVAACFLGWERAVFAPAFPFQGRATRGGKQHARNAEGRWSAVGGDIVTALRALGASAQPGRLDAPLPPGISVFDAETDADLARIAALGRRSPGPVLWIGAGGLAQALAAELPRARSLEADSGSQFASELGTRPSESVNRALNPRVEHIRPTGSVGMCSSEATGPLPTPVLGLFGSDQAATAGQLAACGPDWESLPDGGPASAERIARRLRDNGRALVSLGLPPGLARDEAARCIDAELARLTEVLPRPGTLLAAGGETLSGLCVALGARSLEVQGRIVPGLPRSIMRGGRWGGVTVVSKSGAFGTPTLLRDLLRGDLTQN